MSEDQVVRQETFDDLQLSIIEQNGEEWFSAEDIGKALGMEDPRKSVVQIFRRNRDEFEGLSRVVSLTTWLKSGGKLPYRYTVFNPQGAYLLAILARTPKSKALRRWLAKFMAHDLNHLRDTVAEMQNTILNLAAEKFNVEEEAKELQGQINRLTRDLDKARKLLIAAPKALPAPASTASPYQLDQQDELEIVRINYADLKELVKRGGFQEPYNTAFLCRVLDAQATPDQDLKELSKGIQALGRLMQQKHLADKLCQACRPSDSDEK